MRMRSRVRRDDRGAVLILVAVFAIVAVIFLAFVVDIGNQRQDRRQLATATDASALDVATRWSDVGLAKLANFTLVSGNSFKGVYDCTADAQDFLDRNREVDAGDYDCRAEILSPRLATVRVFARGETDYQVAPAIGIEQGGIGSSTAVKITANPFGGLRPFAVCASQPAFNAWYSSADAQNPNTVTRVTVTGDKFLPAECGSNNSDWGFVQFETQDSGTGNGNDNKLAGTMKNGSDDMITPYYDATNAHRQRCLKSYSQQKSDHGAVSCIFDTSGAGGWNNNNTMDAFKHLIGPPAITFALPIYDRIVDLGGGKTGFPVIGFAEARLVSYVQGGAKDNSVTLDLVQAFTTQPGFIGPNNRILEICDVGTTGGAQLASFTTACQPVAAGGGGAPPVGSSDPCTITGVTPATQDVPVQAGSSTASVSVQVTVADATDCGTLAVNAVDGSPPVGIPQVSQTGNTYRFTRGSGAPFGAAGRTFVVEVSEGGTVRNDSARMRTVGATPVCNVTGFSVSPPTVRATGSGDLHSSNPSFTVSATASDASACSGMTVRLIRTSSPERTMAGTAGAGFSTTYGDASNVGEWQRVVYRIEAVRASAVVATGNLTITN